MKQHELLLKLEVGRGGRVGPTINIIAKRCCMNLIFLLPYGASN